MQIAVAINWAKQQLTDSDSAKLDAEVLLSHVLAKPKTYLFTWPEKSLTESELASFCALVKQRKIGHPVAHLLGEKEFWNLTLKITPDTLIPRPETELLVEKALEFLNDKKSPKILDLGTGTGAIALSLAREIPDAKVVATELVEEAVKLAEENARINSISNADIRAGSWFLPINKTEKFDLIVSNPPYIEPHDLHLTKGDVRFEPLSALVSDDNGLADIKLIAEQAKSYMNSGAYLLIEHGYQQASSVKNLLNQSGYKNIKCYADLNGHDRVTTGNLS